MSVLCLQLVALLPGGQKDQWMYNFFKYIKKYICFVPLYLQPVPETLDLQMLRQKYKNAGN